jgi:Flp pilus assembly CpaE family ATPase
MGRNGRHSNLRVLLSGAATNGVAATLEQAPAITLLRDSDLDQAPSVDVAVFVLDSASSHQVGAGEDARRLREAVDAPLILAVHGEANGIVETGLAVGAADVLLLPQPAETLLFAIRKAANGAATADPGKVITVFSPKGGSGKTVLATNLAVAAARSGVPTLLVDLDLQFGDSALTLGVAPRATIADLVASAGEIDTEKLEAFVAGEPRTGLSVLPAPQRPEEADVVGQAELAAVLEAARSGYDAVVIDTGPLFDVAMLAALDFTDRLLLVCNPEVTSLKNVRIAMETIDRLGFDRERISLVANRLGAAGGVDRRDIEVALDTEIAYDLPDDPEIPSAVNRALPIVLADASSPFARAVGELMPSVVPPPPADVPTASRQRRFLLRGRR